MMSGIYKQGEETYLYTKGSLESIISRSKHILINGEIKTLTNEDKQNYIQTETKMSEESLKVLAFAYKKITKEIKK